jgi:Mn2+/Fe2+ NRAMP family transporter
MIMLANDRPLMGRFTNGRVHNWIVGAIVVFVAMSGTAYAVDSFLQAVHLISG